MSVPTLTLTDFLLARIAEDEAAALAATPGPWRTSDGERNVYESGENSNAAVAVGPYGGDVGDSAVHIARWDPARVLAECEAKRRIVEEHQPYYGSGDCPVCASGAGMDHGEVEVDRLRAPCPTLRLLALPYADHPDYRPEWRP